MTFFTGVVRGSLLRVTTVALVAAMGCGDDDAPARNARDAASVDGATTTPPPPDDDAGSLDGSPAPDATPPADTGPLPDAGPGPDAGPPPSGIAPPAVVPGEVVATDGDNPFTASADAAATFRLDVREGEHVGFFLQFAPNEGDVTMAVLRWDGSSTVQIGITDAGPSLRTLAVVEPAGPRTHWVVVESPTRVSGTLTVTRTPYEDAPACTSDCAKLLQFPLPTDPARDGYSNTSGTVFRYQFGRRDLVMMVRWAGRTLAARGFAPFFPEDFSQWDGETPGIDRGSPRHASHQRGKDVDISLYGTDGTAPWRSYCDAISTSDGRECRAGSMSGFDGASNAAMLESYFATGRVTMCFLDAELIPYVVDGAEALAAGGLLDASLVPLYGDGRHLQHWPNHDNHVHIRVSEEPYDGMAIRLGWPFEAP